MPSKRHTLTYLIFGGFFLGILAVDRILDMFRTTVNVFSDSMEAVVISQLEGDSTEEALPGKEPSPDAS